MLKISTTYNLLALIALGHIALCPHKSAATEGINASYSYSIPTERINYYSNSYLPAENSSREKVVVVSGFGTDADSATLNAAENALNQLVGSILTSEVLVTKRTEIRNGIVDQVKAIKKEITDYSQGAIKSINILDMQKKGDVFIATIRANVRIEDFTKFIKNLAKSEEKIDSGLFAAIATNRSNRATKKDLLRTLLKAIALGEAQTITVGRAFSPGEQFDEYIISPLRWNAQDTIIIPVDISLRPDFYTKLVRTIENLSSQKSVHWVGKGSQGGLYKFKKKVQNTYKDSETRTAFYMDIATTTNSYWKSNLYYMPGLRFDELARSFLPKQRANLKISFLDSTGASTSESIFSGAYCRDTGSSYALPNNSNKIEIFRPQSESLDHELPLLVKGFTKSRCVFNLVDVLRYDADKFYIYSKFRFFIVAELSTEEFQKVRSVSVELIE